MTVAPGKIKLVNKLGVIRHAPQEKTARSTNFMNDVICIGNRTISSTIWKLIDTSNVLKVLVIARADRRVQFKNFQNITSVY